MQKLVNDLILPPGHVASQPTFDASLNYAKRTLGHSPPALPYKVSGVEQDIFLQFSFNKTMFSVAVMLLLLAAGSGEAS